MNTSTFAWSIDNTPAQAPRRKRVLTPEQLLTNRMRSKEYYESHKDKVLEKLRVHYAENREKERQRQREKYRRAKAKKQPMGSMARLLNGPTIPSNNESTPTLDVTDRRLTLDFLLN